ncbi:MAG TPA: heme oxygenase (biliverdin-producing) [Leptolyngbyaceae cyanobacterium M65_K2018_010]|nr:heme oxygenase (biliverdin-producing) [Leptolyngbyaceae cyanobacterium M65_K2018_010]
MTDLAQRLREGTQASHTLSENTAFMKCFLKGVVELEPFRKLTADLYFLYSTLEAEMLRHQDHPVVGPMVFPELFRTQKLEEDLAFYYGDNWRQDIAATPAGEHYVSRIREASRSNPALLVAHAYVRYMGDLSGGQGLRHIARSALNLPPDQGTGLHEFDQLPTVEAKRDFKVKYREALNALPVDETLIQQMVDEANLAFALNRDVFHELEPDVRAAVGDHVFDLITRQDRPGSTERHSHQGMVALVATE